MPNQYEDISGPTSERLRRAGEFFTVAGRGRSKHFTMLDDALGRLWMRQKLKGEEYSALRRYALHWLAGGLQGHLGSVDLNRIFAFDPGSMTGLAKSEAQADHRRLYHRAREAIGIRPAFVADQIACYDSPVPQVGVMLGYRSPHKGRVRVVEILGDAGYRLAQFFEETARTN
jgi:hypothetical protein